MVILIDANILPDFLQERKPFLDAADEIIRGMKCRNAWRNLANLEEKL